MHIVIFSPLQFLCILLLKETFVQIQALEQSPKSQIPACLKHFKEFTELLVFCSQMSVVRYLPLRSCVHEGKD